MSAPKKTKNPSFAPDRLEMINQIEATHFWFQGRKNHINYLFERFLPEKVNTLIDVGCGTGHNLQLWSKYADHVIGIDQYADHTAYHYLDNKFIDLITGDVTDLPIESESVDVVISLDVLEHVSDAEMMKEIIRVLRPGGNFIASVPALPILWSERDIKAGHKRRYTKRTFKSLLKNSGCSVEYINFYQFLLFPIVLVSRSIGRSKKSINKFEEKPGRLINLVFKFITTIEIILIKIGISLPIGSTLIVYARKDK